MSMTALFPEVVPIMADRTRSKPQRGLLAVTAIVIAASAGPAQDETPPFWCQWIPADFWPPDCQVAVEVDPAVSPIEARFATTGSWAITEQEVTDAAGNRFTVFRPVDLGASGVQHPVLTWGNGTGSSPEEYTGTLRHLASWGFVVVASASEETGWGHEILDGVRYMVAQNRSPSSPFYGRLDVRKIGALGHSQGATGALNAAIASKGVITSTVAINLPDPFWFFFNRNQMPNFQSLSAPVFFVTGSSDFLSTSTAQQRYYEQVSGPAKKAALNAGGHNVIQQSDNQMLGYVTAWMMYTLQGDEMAKAAFAGEGAEIDANPSWRQQDQKQLP